MSYVCACNIKFTTWRGFQTHARLSKNYLCRKTFFSNEITRNVNDGEEVDVNIDEQIDFHHDEEDDDQYMPTHNQQAMDLISGEVPHDHPSRADNDMGDSTYLIIQEQQYDSLYGKDALVATDLYDFHRLSRKPDNKTRVETDIYDFVVRNNLSRKEAEIFLDIIKSCASEEYVDIISGKSHFSFYLLKLK